MGENQSKKSSDQSGFNSSSSSSSYRYTRTTETWSQKHVSKPQSAAPPTIVNSSSVFDPPSIRSSLDNPSRNPFDSSSHSYAYRNTESWRQTHWGTSQSTASPTIVNASSAFHPPAIRSSSESWLMVGSQSAAASCNHNNTLAITNRSALTAVAISKPKTLLPITERAPPQPSNVTIQIAPTIVKSNRAANPTVIRSSNNNNNNTLTITNRASSTTVAISKPQNHPPIRKRADPQPSNVTIKIAPQARTTHQHLASKPQQLKIQLVQPTVECSVCGHTTHSSEQCRHRKNSCYNCGVQGHLSSVCKKKKSHPKPSAPSVYTLSLN